MASRDRRYFYIGILLLLAAVFLFPFASSSSIFNTAGQLVPEEPTPNADQIARVEFRQAYDALDNMKGIVTAQGTNSQPSGLANVKTYRVEELTLGGPTKIPVDYGKSVTVDKVWRLVVTSTGFRIGALFYQVYLDDTRLGIAAYSKGTAEISVYVFDRSTLREGGVISVAYGDDRTQLPERLHLGASK